jgi:uncharacterized membrane protein
LTLLLVVFLKLYEILRKVALPLKGWIPMERFAGIAVADLIVVILAIFICFLAGWLAKREWAVKLQRGIENKILIKIPGYTIIQGFTNDLKATEEASSQFTPVLVRFDDQEQLCFQTEELKDGRIVIFVPGAPSPWSGTVVYVDKSRVSKLDINIAEATKNIKSLGLHSDKVISRIL